MTERVLIQKDFPPVEGRNPQGLRAQRPERESSGQTPAEDGRWNWRDRANDVSRSKRRPSRYHIRTEEGQECLIFCRAFRCGP
jgi:hypothetical protein